MRPVPSAALEPPLRTILIADDEAHLRLLVRKTLTEDDYRIVEAADGQEALARARKERPDLDRSSTG